FFQAEDGIRDRTVTGVQTCALPILRDGSDLHLTVQHWFLPNGRSINGTGLTPNVAVSLPDQSAMFDVVQPAQNYAGDTQLNRARSEERRVGKECRTRVWE